MRHALFLSLAAFAALTACTGTTGGDNPGNSGDLPDPFAGLAYDTACDGSEDSDGVFHDIAGATVFWSGTFDLLDGDDVAGTETLVVYANTAWEAAAPDVARDCTIVWNIAGRSDLESNCTTCDYRLTLDANLDTTATTCDITYARAAYDTSYSVSYDVNVTCGAGDVCDARFSYPETGTVLADGNAAGDRLQYTTNRLCQFY